MVIISSLFTFGFPRVCDFSGISFFDYRSTFAAVSDPEKRSLPKKNWQKQYTPCTVRMCVISCLRLACIFIDNTPCPCLSLVFVVGVNVAFFRAPLRLEVSVSFSGGTRFYTKVYPAYPFCAPCLELISATYWLIVAGPSFYTGTASSSFPDCQISLLDKGYLSNWTRPKRFLPKPSISYSDFM